MVDFHHFIYKFFINYRHDGIGEWRVRANGRANARRRLWFFKLFVINYLQKFPWAAAGQGWPALPKDSGRDAVAPLTRYS